MVVITTQPSPPLFILCACAGRCVCVVGRESEKGGKVKERED